MANIRNSISMKDQMTPVLRSVMKSMNSMLKLMEQMDKQSSGGKQSKAYKQAEKDIKQADNALKKFRNDTDGAGKSAQNLATKYELVNKALRNSPVSLGNIFQGLASGIYTLQHITRLVTGVMDKIDQAQSQAARLALFDDTEATGKDLYGAVFKTAMDTRSGLNETANLAQKIVISGVFDGEGATGAAIKTAGIINKALVAGGGTQEENKRALLQLTQGLASGVLQGDELRSIREQAPQFAQYLAEGLGKVDKQFEGIGIGDLKKLGAEGELTSSRIIKAMFAMEDQVSSDFEEMPRTFGQAVTSLGNIWQYFLFLLSSTEGPLGSITDMLWNLVDYLQSDEGSHLLQTMALGLNIVAWSIAGVMKIGGGLINFFSEHKELLLGLIGAIAAYNAIMLIANGILAVSTFLDSVKAASSAFKAGATLGEAAATTIATGAQVGLNAAMYACPVVWIVVGILLIIAAIIALIAWIAKLTGAAETALGGIMGALFTAGAAIWNLFLGLVDLALGCINALVNPWITFINFFGNLFNDPIASIIHLFGGLADTVLGIIETIAKALDKVFGSSMADTVSGWRSGLSGWIEDAANKHGNGKYEKVMEELDLSSESLGLSRWEYGDAWDSGVKFGDNLSAKLDSMLDFDFSSLGLGDAPVEIGGGQLDKVGKIDSDVAISDEDIQLLRDMAARDYLLQLQTVTPVAHVSFGDVRETADVNKIMEVIEEMVEEQMATSLSS